VEVTQLIYSHSERTVSRRKRGNSFTKRASTGTLSEPAHDQGVTPPADQAISVGLSTGYTL